MPTDDAFWDLSAKVTALEIILETLVSDQLEEEDNPEEIADLITKSAFATEKKVRDQLGENALSMKVTEVIVSLMDRALERAVARKRHPPRSSPK
jgi:hypothetical protein